MGKKFWEEVVICFALILRFFKAWESNHFFRLIGDVLTKHFHIISDLCFLGFCCTRLQVSCGGKTWMALMRWLSAFVLFKFCDMSTLGQTKCIFIGRSGVTRFVHRMYSWRYRDVRCQEVLYLLKSDCSVWDAYGSVDLVSVSIIKIERDAKKKIFLCNLLQGNGICIWQHNERQKQACLVDKP